MIALDTNVLIYAYDKAEPERQRTAVDLISQVKDGVLLWQVACEFIAASRKLHGLHHCRCVESAGRTSRPLPPRRAEPRRP